MNPVSNMLTIQLNSTQNTEIDKSLRSQQKLVARLAQNGFMSRDQEARLSVSSEERASLKSSSLQLLGGREVNVEVERYNLETDQMMEVEYDNPKRISIVVGEGSVHITVTQPSDDIDQVEPQVIFDGDCAANQILAENLIGKIKISIKNNTQAPSKGSLEIDKDW